MHSFKTHDVEIEKLDLLTVSSEKLWSSRFTRSEYVGGESKLHRTGNIWKCSGDELLNISNNALIASAGLAYNKHLPLSLSPDAIWSAIAHGFSIWINENAEKVRDKFVEHKGKVKLTVDIPAHEASAPNWDHILGTFSEMLADYVGKKRRLFVNDFSTTTVDSRIGSEAVLMYAMGKYFEYGMRTTCAFPRITLEGAPRDWGKIVDRVRYMSDFSFSPDDQLKLWTDRLLPVVEEFASASKGKPDIGFWRGFYREDGGSGGPFVDGHVTSLFPYLRARGNSVRRNKWKTGMFGGSNPADFPSLYSPVEVEWEDTVLIRDMKFHGGVVGVSYSNNIVRPEVGWCVSEDIEKVTI